jgi:hypothetical protein
MRPSLSGRAAKRAHRNSLRLRGAGWTRSWRKGRTKRYPPVPEEVTDVQQDDQSDDS